MATVIKTLNASNGDIILPRTRSAAVTMADGTTTLDEITDIWADVTSTASELNILDGATLTVTELNYVDGVTSAIQTQLDAKFPLRPTLNEEVDTYTIVLADANTRIKATKSTAFTITIPLNATTAGFVVGDSIEIIQWGAGAITIAIEATGTLVSKGSKVLTDGQYSAVTITKMATDTWWLVGALA